MKYRVFLERKAQKQLENLNNELIKEKIIKPKKALFLKD